MNNSRLWNALLLCVVSKREMLLTLKGASIGNNKIYTSEDHTAKNGDLVYVDTSSSVVTITLPMAVDGMRVRVIDMEWTFDVNTCNVVDVNGTIINKITDGTPYEIDIKGATRTLEVVKNTSDILEWRTV